MKKVALLVGSTAIVSFAAGYYLGGSAKTEPPSRHSVTDLDKTMPLSESPVSGRPAPGSTGIAGSPADSMSQASDVFTGTREVTPEFRASMEKGARNAHAPFFLLYDIPPAEVDAIVKGMAEGQIEQIEFLEKMAILEGRAPLGDSRLTAADQQVADDLIAAHKSRRAGKSRQLLGSYYDDYQRYLTTMKEHELIAKVSTGLNQPINSVTRDELLQIMVEERLYGWQRGAAAGLTKAPILEELTRDERLEQHRQRVELFGQRSARIKERARSYLSTEEYALLAKLLDREVERREADTRVRELSDDP